jgi:hypothetical protein
LTRLILYLSACCVLAPALALAQEQLFSGSSLLDLAGSELAGGNVAVGIALLEAVEREPPADAGAWLDVGILYCAAGSADRAERVFRTVETRFAPPPAIRQVIDHYRKQGCSPPGQAGGTLGSLQVVAGATNNVNYGPARPTVRLAPSAPFSELTLRPSSLAQSDSFIGIDGGVERSLASVPGTSVFGAAQFREHRKHTRFDTMQLIGGLFWRTTLSGVQPDLQAYLSYQTMGGSPYEAALNVQAGCWCATWKRDGMALRWGGELEMVAKHYPNNAVYDSRSAELRLKAQWQLHPGTSLQFQTGLARDMAVRDRPGGDREGRVMSIAADTGPNDRQRLALSLQRQTLSDTNPYSPLFFGTAVRQARTTQISARYTYRYHAGSSLYAQWSSQRVNDRIDLFSVRVDTLSIGHVWMY